MPLTYINTPNFFILGAGKSGTTSLYHYLKQHPDIYLTPVKEPTFFSEGFQVVHNPITYFELYDSVSTEKIRGEASHAYLSNPSTAKVLKGLFPDSKFLVILRNPADRAYSLYHHMRRAGFEYINTFEKALEAEEQRNGSREFMKKCPRYYYNFLYFRSGLYGEQLKRYFSLFAREQFHIMSLDQLITDPLDSLKDIFQFLEVDEDFVPAMEVHNSGKVTARFAKLHYFFRTKVTKPESLRKFCWARVERLNSMKVPPMREETRSTLLNRYQTDLKNLHELTGIKFVDP